MYIVKPERSFAGNFTSFKTVEAFEKWLVQNTGYFEVNENIVLVNYELQDCKFYKLIPMIAAFEMRHNFEDRKLKD